MAEHPRALDFLLLPDFPLYAVVPAIEALRIANQNAGLALYRWRFVSASGGTVRASNGMAIDATVPVGSGAMPDCLLVCAGNEPTQHLTKPLLAWLRRLSAHGSMLGALDTGAFALAVAGVIRDRCVTLHWEAIPVFRDAFPRVQVREQIYVLDRDIVTAAGGAAALDLMVAMIGRAHGARLAQVVADAFVAGQPRPAETPQRMEPAPGQDDQTMLRRALRVMQDNIEYCVTVSDICRELGVSRRRLERTFAKQTGRSPASAYMEIRLSAARDQLFYSSNSMAHIATVTGFLSASHFCRAFRKQFGVSPSVARRRFNSETRSQYYPTGFRLLNGDHPT